MSRRLTLFLYRMEPIAMFTSLSRVLAVFSVAVNVVGCSHHICSKTMDGAKETRVRDAATTRNPRLAMLIEHALTAETIAERAGAILASTEDDPTDNLVRTLAAVRQARSIVSHNIANTQTIGFKASRPVFVDGHVAIQLDLEQGTPDLTNRPSMWPLKAWGFFV